MFPLKTKEKGAFTACLFTFFSQGNTGKESEKNYHFKVEEAEGQGAEVANQMSRWLGVAWPQLILSQWLLLAMIP